MTTTTPPAPASAGAPHFGLPTARDTSVAHLAAVLTWSVEHALLAALAYVPFLVVRQGVVTPDTKTYLYLDPGRFLSQVPNMWNPTVGLGTVNHQYIGYLLPMGPFYGLLSALGLPIWVAQRLWLGTILFAAGTGVLYLSKVLGLRGPGRAVAALAFMLTPYFLQYSGRISVILLPWAGLPWMIAFAALALRRGGWRYPALFALVVALVSSINAAAIIYVGLAPVLWLLYAVGIEHEGSWHQGLIVALKITLLTFLVSLWWVAGLGVEALYGVNVLKFTETVPSTSQTANASEVIRGLGYWYFYGGDRLGPWTRSSVLYTNWVWLLFLSYLGPILAFCSAVFVRWRHRAYFVLLVVLGLVLSVGAHPFEHPTPAGGVLKAFMTDTTAGLALRSTDRATPLVIMGLAVLLGSGVSALWRRFPRTGLGSALVVAGLIIANNPAIFTGDAVVASDFTQPANVPATVSRAAAHLSAIHPGTRVLEVPGNDFAAQRWGDTIDPSLPALLSDARAFALREQQILGSQATANMLYAIDQPMQSGIEQWNALAPLARLISAGDVVVQNDTAYERYGIPQPQLLNQQLSSIPFGLSDPRRYGRPVPNVAVTSTLNEADLATVANPRWPAPLVSYTVDAPRPVTRAESQQGALVVAGDATGLYNLAAAGLLSTDSAIYYAGTLDSHPAQLAQLIHHGAALVVTDTNRKQSYRWDTLTANTGYTENATENPAKTDLSDSPVELFPGAPIGAHTLAADTGALEVTASSYGNPVSYTPENRPYNAVDPTLDTAWETGVFDPNPTGQWWQIRLRGPVTEDHVTLVQTQSGDLSRWITRATLSFDGGRPISVDLGPRSRMASGQVISFSPRRFSTLRVTIARTSNDHAPTASASEVGLAEVAIPGVSVHEVISLPTDLLAAAGTSSIGNRLTLSLARDRVSPFPTRSDPELTITRAFNLPTARTFALSGAASLSSLIPDDQIDRLMGRVVSRPGIDAVSNGRLPGALTATAGSALDANPATAWEPGFGTAFQQGDWLQYTLPAPITLASLNLSIIADGRHSVPAALTVSTENGARQVSLPSLADSSVAGATTRVLVPFPALTGRHLKVTVTAVRGESASNYFSPTPLGLPMGLAEVGIPGAQVAPLPAQLPGDCRANLLRIDGWPIYLQVLGTTASALGNGEVRVQTCGPDAAGITLSPGPHSLATALGHDPNTGWNIDQLVLDSAAGGGPGSTTSTPTSPAATQPGPAPQVGVTDSGATGVQAVVSAVRGPFELVLGESQNDGWHAVASPGPNAPPGSHSVDLGRSQLVDGFANGWAVTASQLASLGVPANGSGGDFTVSFKWAPQSWVWGALVVSAAAMILCLGLVFWPTARRIRRRIESHTGGERARHRARPLPPYAPPDQAVGAAAPVRVPALLDPTVAPRLAPRGIPLPTPVIVVVALVTGLVAGLISSPWIGLGVLATTALTLAVPKLRGATALLALGLLAAGALSVAFGQALHPVVESSNWPAGHEGAGRLVWAGVVFLGADAVVEITRRVVGRTKNSAGPAATDQR